MFECSMYGVHLHSSRLKTGQSCEQCFLLLGPREGCKSSSSCCICWILWLVFTGVVTRFAEVFRTFVVSSSVRNCSSRLSSATNTIWGIPDTFVAFASVGPLAVSDAGFTEFLTSRIASVCPLSIISRIWLVAPELCVSLVLPSSGASCLSPRVGHYPTCCSEF